MQNFKQCSKYSFELIGQKQNLENKSLYPNQSYYEDLRENALISRELLEQIPFNDELSL